MNKVLTKYQIGQEVTTKQCSEFKAIVDIKFGIAPVPAILYYFSPSDWCTEDQIVSVKDDNSQLLYIPELCLAGTSRLEDMVKIVAPQWLISSKSQFGRAAECVDFCQELLERIDYHEQKSCTDVQ